MIAYRAMLDVPRELVQEVARLLRAERRARGTRPGTRALTCWNQALFGLAWFRNQGDVAVVGAGFGVSRATAYRYRDEVIDVLAAQAPDLHEALAEVAEQGWSHVVVDGKVFRTDRTAETTTSVRGQEINTWYSGKHRAFGGNVQAVMRPDGMPMWVSDVVAGHHHDMTAARLLGALGALYWAASQLGLPCLADGGYAGAGHGVHTPIKQPGGGQVLAPDNQAYNALHRATRCRGERGFALLTGRWRALRRITASPAESATTSKPDSSCSTSNNSNYALLVEITSMGWASIHLRFALDPSPCSNHTHGNSAIREMRADPDSVRRSIPVLIALPHSETGV